MTSYTDLEYECLRPILLFLFLFLFLFVLHHKRADYKGTWTYATTVLSISMGLTNNLITTSFGIFLYQVLQP